MFSWSVPDEIINFVFNEFYRFGAPNPPDKEVDLVCDHVLLTMASTPYRLGPEQLVYRYHTNPGFNDQEMIIFVDPIRSRIKESSDDQVHLIAWAAWMYCLTDKGEEHVEWFKINEVSRNNQQPGKVLQFPPVAL